MPRIWPDPRDPEPPPSRVREVMVYFAVAVIGAMMIANLVRDALGMGWNW